MWRDATPESAGHGRHPGARISPARLDALIGEAIGDAYDESEQAVGFHATIEQHLALPFETVVLGIAVTVKTLDVAESGHIVAICHRGRERQAIPILELPLPEPLPLAGSGSRRFADGPRAAGRGGSRR